MSDKSDLLAAVKAKDAKGVRAILDRDPSLARMKTENGTIVLTAVYYGAGDAAKVLLERVQEDELNLYEAAALGHARRLKTILGQSRTRVNDANPEGFTPLGLAAFFGRPEAVQVMLEHGADANFVPPSRFGNAALDAAVAGNHADIVRVLLAAGAKVNLRDAVGATPLHKAAMHGNLEVAKMLLERGADVNATRDGGHTPLADANEKGHAAIVKLLEAHDAKA